MKKIKSIFLLILTYIVPTIYTKRKKLKEEEQWDKR